ncbi:unnamed protein product [Rotaria sp. Silwood1]|nr:unnamed protein product [Rotaria sp. Silwood1]
MSATDSTFRVEYAKSDRSKCKSCWSTIDTDSSRFTFMTYSSKFDGKEDQDKIRHRIQENATVLSSGNDANDTFSVQYAKSNRSTCHSCDKSIDKDTLHLSRTKYTSKRARSYGPTDEWYHVDCFYQMKKDLGFSGNAESLILIDTVTDYMAFSALEPCPECGGSSYFQLCKLSLTPCSYSTILSKRKPFEMPDKIKEKYDILPDYDSKSPLNGYSIALVGRLSKKTNEVQKASKKIQDAQYFEIHIVPEQFLDDILNDQSSIVMEKLKLTTCGKLPHIRKQQNKNFRLHLNLWGRTGTTFGGHKIEEYYNQSKAINAFHQIFFDKTGNHWTNRTNRETFKKLPTKHYSLEIDYGQHSNDDDDIQKALNNSNAKNCSHLPSPVQDLICLIFNIETMKETLLSFEIDLTKMPLGKLSSNQLKKAYQIKHLLLMLVIDFIHLFLMILVLKTLKILDNIELIQSKTQMINNLLETEIVCSMLKGSTDEENEHPIDVHYKKIKMHGSRTTNFVGILSQGLRIAPPEAPVVSSK